MSEIDETPAERHALAAKLKDVEDSLASAQKIANEVRKEIWKAEKKCDELAVKLEVAKEALLTCDRLFLSELSKMIEWGPDFNRAVKDVAVNVRLAFYNLVD